MARAKVAAEEMRERVKLKGGSPTTPAEEPKETKAKK